MILLTLKTGLLQASEQYLVQLNRQESFGASLSQIESILNKDSGSKLDYVQIKIISRKFNILSLIGNNISSKIKLLNNIPGVKAVEQNFQLALNKPVILKKEKKSSKRLGLWGIKNRKLKDSRGLVGRSDVDVSASEAWRLAQGSRDIIVGVIDTGVDYTHPSLKGRMWINQEEAKGKQGIDDDGNGHIDDIHGVDFTKDSTPSGNDNNGHGTHVAGTIAAASSPFGHAGIAPNAKIMALKFLDSKGKGDFKGLIKALDYVVKMNVSILNHSWGYYGKSEILRNIFEQLDQNGILSIVAAGNHARSYNEIAVYPAAFKYKTIISVAAINHSGEPAFFSAWHPNKVHVSAPGQDILSCWPRGGYRLLSGTSMAAPHVTGIAALVKGQNPTFDHSQIKERILKTASPLYTVENMTSSGRMVNAYGALNNHARPSILGNPMDWHFKEVNIETDHPYNNDLNKKFKIHIPGAKRLAVYFETFKLERHDTLYFEGPKKSFFSKAPYFGKWTGSYPARYSPLVEGDTMILRLQTDWQDRDHGFRITKVAYQ
jgi:subtilisin family serine protease